MEPTLLLTKVQILGIFTILALSGIVIFEYGVRNSFHKGSLIVVGIITVAAIVGAMLLPFGFV